MSFHFTVDYPGIVHCRALPRNSRSTETLIKSLEMAIKNLMRLHNNRDPPIIDMGDSVSSPGTFQL